MATGISAALNSMSCRIGRNSFPATGPSSVTSLSSFLTPATQLKGKILPLWRRRRRSLGRVCLAMEKKIEDGLEIEKDSPPESSKNRVSERVARKKVERYTYLVAAVMSSLGITSMAIVSVYYRFSWQMEVPFFFFFSSLVQFLPLASGCFSLLIMISLKMGGSVTWHGQGGEIPVLEMLGTFALSVGAAVS